MAFNQRYRPPARQHSVAGSGSSHSCLDGVPFKISPTFRPVPQPSLPSELLRDALPRSGPLYEEYDYETEEGVLAWARAREEAKVKALAEREMAERARAALAAAESSSSSESEDDVALQPPQTCAGADTTREPAAPPQQGARPPWQLPLAASVGSTILTPMPIQTTKTKVQSPLVPKNLFDLAMFEQEGDPFENLELQTIDDMEELRALLERISTTEPSTQEPSSDPDIQAMYSNSEMVNSQLGEGGPQEPDASGDEVPSEDKIYVNVTVRSGMDSSVSKQSGEDYSDDTGSALEGSGMSSSVCKTSNPNCDFVIEPTGDGDYVMIRSDYSQKSVTSHDSQSVYANLGSEADPADSRSEEEDSQDLYTNSQAFTSAQPPVLPRVQSLLGDRAGLGASGKTTSIVFNPAVRYSLPRTSGSHADVMASRMSQSAYAWSDSSPSAWGLDPPTSAGTKDTPPTYSNFPFSDSISVMTASTPAFSNMFYSSSARSQSGSVNQMNSARSQSGSVNQINSTRSQSGSVSQINSARSQSGSVSQISSARSQSGSVSQISSARSQSGSVSQVDRTVEEDRRPSVPSAVTNDNHTYSNLPSSDVNSIMTVSMPAFSNNFYDNSDQQESESSAPGSIMSPTGGALRNARSNPDLSAAAHGSLPSPQPWNPYKPLPPPPSSDLRSSSSSTESLPTEPSQNPSPMVLSPSPGEFGAAAPRLPGEGEMDPYHRLSSDAKMFVNNLTPMGFSRSRVSRAVEKFGLDEKEVLDHLFNVEKLVEKKFTPALVEMSLQLFKNDMRKAEQFLDLFQQFRELGFTSERIQTALVKHELDRDKALDYLTT